MNGRLQFGLLLLALLVGFGLRIQGLAAMNDSILYDEAAYGVDALSLLDEPRVQVYFTSNNGREGLWMALVAPALAAWGAQPFSLRIVAVFAGLLTLAAVYRLGCEVFASRWAAIGAVAALAVFYWPVHLSHIGFRAALYPLLGALSFAALLNAYRTNRLDRWLLSGVLLALLAYTYLAARIWIGLAILLLLSWLLRGRAQRGATLALLVLGVGVVPLVFALIQADGGRTSQVAITSLDQFIDNLRLWMGAWLVSGDAYLTHNLPERPIFDLPTAMLALAGVVGLVPSLRRRWQGLLLALLLLGSLLPALLSIDNPHMLRAYGAVIPLALLLGAGVGWLVRRGSLGLIGALLLLSAMALLTARDFAQVVDQFDVFLPGETKLLAAIDAVSAVPGDETVAFAPLPHDYPVVPFQRNELAPREWLAYDPGYCLVYDVSDTRLAVTLSPQIDYHRERLTQWVDVMPMITDPAGRYEILRVAPLPPSDAAAVFGDSIHLAPLARPRTASPGETLTITLAIRGLMDGNLNGNLNGFVQLWGDPSPLEGGQLWAQADQRLCEPYPVPAWQPTDHIVQDWTLSMPANTLPGDYQVMVGVYDPGTGVRLQRPDSSDIAELFTIRVTGSDQERGG